MNEKRIHRAVSADGTEIAGRVVGEGSALVLVHGGIGHGDLAWKALLPHLTDRFTCYLPSTRGRGLSGDHPDHTPPRLVEDVTAFVDSVGEPVCLVGWSGSGPWCLGAAAQSDSVIAVAAYEPVVPGSGETDTPRLGAALEKVGMAAADGRLVDAVRAFAAGICTDGEVAALEQTTFFERWRTPSRLCSTTSGRTTPTRAPGPSTPNRSHRSPRRCWSCAESRPCSLLCGASRNSTLPCTSPTRTSASCWASATSRRCSHPSSLQRS
jgi:pimeloyl-ACP methyl ester carboxylesterase